MKYLLLLFYLSFRLSLFSQKVEPIPITRDEIRQFRTVNDAIKLPASYVVQKGTLIVAFKYDTFVGGVSGPNFSEDVTRNMFPYLTSGDRVTFEDVIVLKGDRRIKLVPKVYVIK